MKNENNINGSSKSKNFFIVAIVCILLCIPLGILIGKSLKDNFNNNEIINVEENNESKENESNNLENKSDENPFYVAKNLELTNIIKNDAITIYEKFMFLSTVLGENDYYFDNEHIYNNWDAYWVQEKTNLFNWFAVNSEDILDKQVDVSNGVYNNFSSILPNDKDEELSYEITGKMILNSDIKVQYYKKFMNELDYQTLDKIYIEACRVGLYDNTYDAYI